MSECKFCSAATYEKGKILAFCENCREWLDVSLGQCFGNCKAQVPGDFYCDESEIYREDI